MNLLKYWCPLTLRGQLLEDAVKYLSEVITFFHTNNVFTHENSPTLDKNIQKLIIEINPNDTDDMYHFWSMAGISYLPSIIYRVRMVAFWKPSIRSATSNERNAIRMINIFTFAHQCIIVG